MALFDVKAVVDGKQVTKGFDRMLRSSAKVKTFYNAMKRPVKGNIKEHGDSQAGPDGAWPKRDKKYMETARRRKLDRGAQKALKLISLGGRAPRARRRKPPKRMLGKLTRSVRQRSTKGGLFIESPISWAGIHQKGGTAGRGAIIPARPFLWLSSTLMKFAANLHRDFVLAEWPAGTKVKVR